jgi:hypothetical protein
MQFLLPQTEKEYEIFYRSKDQSVQCQQSNSLSILTRFQVSMYNAIGM